MPLVVSESNGLLQLRHFDVVFKLQHTIVPTDCVTLTLFSSFFVTTNSSVDLKAVFAVVDSYNSPWKENMYFRIAKPATFEFLGLICTGFLVDMHFLLQYPVERDLIMNDILMWIS